nr:unnamed protein product [Digitaria exilis]
MYARPTTNGIITTQSYDAQGRIWVAALISLVPKGRLDNSHDLAGSPTPEAVARKMRPKSFLGLIPRITILVTVHQYSSHHPFLPPLHLLVRRDGMWWAAVVVPWPACPVPPGALRSAHSFHKAKRRQSRRRRKEEKEKNSKAKAEVILQANRGGRKASDSFRPRGKDGQLRDAGSGAYSHGRGDAVRKEFGWVFVPGIQRDPPFNLQFHDLNPRQAGQAATAYRNFTQTKLATSPPRTEHLRELSCEGEFEISNELIRCCDKKDKRIGEGEGMDPLTAEPPHEFLFLPAQFRRGGSMGARYRNRAKQISKDPVQPIWPNL